MESSTAVLHSSLISGYIVFLESLVIPPPVVQYLIQAIRQWRTLRIASTLYTTTTGALAGSIVFNSGEPAYELI